jgi:hypothetical protein
MYRFWFCTKFINWILKSLLRVLRNSAKLETVIFFLSQNREWRVTLANKCIICEQIGALNTVRKRPETAHSAKIMIFLHAIFCSLESINRVSEERTDSIIGVDTEDGDSVFLLHVYTLSDYTALRPKDSTVYSYRCQNCNCHSPPFFTEQEIISESLLLLLS